MFGLASDGCGQRWDPNDPTADSIEVLREKADIAEAGRLAALWMSDPAAALIKEQEKKDRNDEVEEILKQQGSRLLRQPKNVITAEEMNAVR